MTISKFLNPKNDIAFKHIFGSEKHKDILIHFINDIMQLHDDKQIVNVTFLSPIQDPEISSKKQSIVDVLCVDKNGVQIIVEMQVSPTKGFEKRAQYYAAKAYIRQLNKGKADNATYHNLKEIIFIAISDCIVFPDKSEYISHHVILDKLDHKQYLKDFSFSFIELPKFHISNIQNLNTIIEKWCYFFIHAASTTEDELQTIVGTDTVIAQAYAALNQFNWTEQELLLYEEEQKRVMDNKAADDYIKDIAQAQGEAIGLVKGEAIGIAKGEAELNKKLHAIATTLLTQGISIEIIMMSTGLSREAIEVINSNLFPP